MGTPPLATDKGLINEHGVDVQVTDIMAQFPRWRGLKHICNPLTKDFTDGQTHFDIFKIRMLAGLRVLTESRIELLKRLLRRYEACCKKVTDVYGKTFAWPKQHFLVHMIPDILAKASSGTPRLVLAKGCTKVAQHYMHTNFRDVDPQVAHRDEEQEAIARTRLTVDDFFRRARNEGDGDQDEEESQKRSFAPVPPTTGSSDRPSALATVAATKISMRERPLFRNFDPRLRSVLREVFPVEFLRYEDTVKIELFRCLYIAYQSQDDWREGEDILRCHADWYRRGPRYDCLLFDAADERLACARLRSLVRCQLPSGRIVDVAMVQLMQKSSWRPRTHWDGCLVFDECREIDFLLVEHIVRGAPAPVRPAPSGRSHSHYLVDFVDGDMFLRCLNSTTCMLLKFTISPATRIELN
ncbi:hypothetical protein B0H14DRAFT_3884659 [Mycena olivaceomarginata]|nr:hypothetical protein B0H14DRAFT_3884659 [Mycena olivaceomarginata]